MKENFYDCDVLLIGAGIMSATLATLLHETYPTLRITMIEKLDAPAMESSNAFNNAGTGHAGFCELNFTPFVDGKVDITKAVKVNERFKISKQFWSYLITKGRLNANFIHRVPHVSFVHGNEDVFFLEKRWEALKAHHMFSDMQFTTDANTIKEWAPLMMTGRGNEQVAATKMDRGTDVDYGNLTKQLMAYVGTFAKIKYMTSVTDIEKFDICSKVTLDDGTYVLAHHVFVGAGGAALPLLQKSKIPEINGYGGFPVSGEFLICDDETVVSQHNAKVYGKASIGAPPMSVPHLDTRIIDGKKCLIFGPYAGFSTKFLKTGHWFDLFKSMKTTNIGTMLKAGASNIALTKYLIKEVLRGRKSKFKSLKEFYPEADINDWRKLTAGQRVQIMKMENGEAIIEFGTEVVSSKDGGVIGLLGASPGASTAVFAMLDVMDKIMGASNASKKLNEMIPSLNVKLKDNPDMFDAIEVTTSRTLKLV